MKTKIYQHLLFGSLIFCALTGITSCSDDDAAAPTPALDITTDTGLDAVMQLDTIRLSAQVQNAIISQYSWQIDGKTVSTQAECNFMQIRPGTYTLRLTATSEDGSQLNATKQIEVTDRFANGVFVLNEGNMSNETGTLTYISNEGILTDSAYYRINGTLLGNVCQDLFITDGKIYIISQNGTRNGGEGLLTVAKAGSLEKIQVYNDDTQTLSWPSNIAVVDKDIYLRDNAGIYRLELENNSLTFVEGTARAKKARMAVIGNKVFAMNGQKIQVIENGAVSADIKLPGTPSGIARSYDDKLWASCSSPAQILKINPDDYTIEAHDIAEGGLSMGWGVAPAFAATSDTLYYSNAGFNLYRHVFSQNKTEFMTNIQEGLPDAKMYYNSLGVNPANGQVIFATIKGYGMDYLTNDVAVFDFQQNPPMIHDFKNVNSFPAGVYATAYFK